MKKFIFALFFTVVSAIFLLVTYINIFWPKDTLLKSAEDILAQRFSMSISIDDVKFTLTRGVQFSGIKINKKTKTVHSFLSINTLHTGHKIFWHLLKNKDTLPLTINGLKFISSDKAQRLFSKKMSHQKSLRNPWLINIQKALSPLNIHFETLLKVIFTRLSSHWKKVKITFLKGDIVTDFFIQGAPLKIQSLTKKNWTHVEGTFILDIKSSPVIDLHLKAIYETSLSSLHLKTVDSLKHIHFLYKGPECEFKGESFLQKNNIQIKSIIGTYKHFKFYSRGTIDSNNLNVDLSNIVNVDLDKLSYFSKNDFKPIGQSDIFLSIKGPLLQFEKLMWKGSLTSDSLTLGNKTFKNLSIDFEYQQKLLFFKTINISGMNYTDSIGKKSFESLNIQGSGFSDWFETNAPLHLEANIDKISFENLSNLIGLYLPNPPLIIKNSDATIHLSLILPLLKIKQYKLEGSLKSKNIDFVAEHPLCSFFEKTSHIPLRNLRPNKLSFKFRCDSNSLKIHDLQFDHKNLQVISQGTLDPFKNISFRLATTEKYFSNLSESRQKLSEKTKQHLLKIEGTIDQPQFIPVQPIQYN
ncbi:hypothetical protein AB834_00920 [PVC group bacterium (ex Bugula neritina AB1)]|nr:hypothetical protein AB834_00920 [PVC group bacterium (ex Bugula neritina AB1)]